MASLPTAQPIQTQGPLLRVPQRILKRLLDRLTPYAKLNAATSDNELLIVIEDLKGEWRFAGTVLLGMAAITFAAFAITPDSAYPVGSGARVVIWCTCYLDVLGFLFTCCLAHWAPSDANSFRDEAADPDGTYLIFALQARIPVLCIFLSSVFLAIFTALVTSHSGIVASFAITFVLAWTARRWVYGIRYGLRRVWQSLSGWYECIGAFVNSFCN